MHAAVTSARLRMQCVLLRHNHTASTAFLNVAVHSTQAAVQGRDAVPPLVVALQSLEQQHDPHDPHACFLMGSAVTAAASVRDVIVRSVPNGAGAEPVEATPAWSAIYGTCRE